MSSQIDVAIIGGGPAGAAAAIRLARAGREVALFERTIGDPHKVCGEFLEAATLDELQCLGIDTPALGATTIDTLAIIRGDRLVETALAEPAMSLSRQTLDRHLLDTAAGAGATIRRNIHVGGYETTGTGYIVHAGHQRLVARHLLIATGKQDLKDARRDFDVKSDYIGFKLHLTISATSRACIDGRVVLVAFRGGYAGLQPIGMNHANLCLVVRRSLFDHGPASWDLILRTLQDEHPYLADLLSGAEPLWPKPLAVGRIPYGYLRTVTDGPWWLGDQAAVIPSFAGAGIGMALRSARLASVALLAQTPAQSFQMSFADQMRPVVRRSVMVSRLILNPYGNSILTGVLTVLPGLLRGLARSCALPRELNRA